MKLSEIKNINGRAGRLSEGVVPIHLTLTLKQVIDAGKVTNNVQHFVIANLISHFKDGAPMRWERDLNHYSMNANSAIVDAVKNLTPDESVEMATWLLDTLNQIESVESQTYAGANMNTDEWMRFVLRRQD
jgi:hypothetical protein